jgi:hypothetical protein
VPAPLFFHLLGLLVQHALQSLACHVSSTLYGNLLRLLQYMPIWRCSTGISQLVQHRQKLLDQQRIYGIINFTAQDRQSKMGTGSVAAIKLRPAKQRLRRRCLSPFSTGPAGNAAEKGDRHRGGSVSTYATMGYATEPVPIFRESCAVKLGQLLDARDGLGMLTFPIADSPAKTSRQLLQRPLKTFDGGRFAQTECKAKSVMHGRGPARSIFRAHHHLGQGGQG